MRSPQFADDRDLFSLPHSVLRTLSGAASACAKGVAAEFAEIPMEKAALRKDCREIPFFSLFMVSSSGERFCKCVDRAFRQPHEHVNRDGLEKLLLSAYGS